MVSIFGKITRVGIKLWKDPAILSGGKRGSQEVKTN